MSTSLARPTGLRADAARNRAQVLRVAREHLLAGGDELSMNTLAREASVGIGTVYRHFATQQALLESLAVDSLEALVVAAEAATRLPDAGAALAGLLGAALERQLVDPALARVLAVPGFTCADSLELGARLARASGEVIDRARRAGAIRGDITPDDLRRLLCGLERAVRAGVADEDPLPWQRYLQVVVQGLRPPAA